MQIHPLWHYKQLCIGVSFSRVVMNYGPYIFLLTLVLAACSGSSTPTTGNSTATSGNSTTATVTSSSPPQIKLGTQPCPGAVKDPAYWDAIIGTQNGVSKAGSVSCANLIGQASLQALILVGYEGADRIADVYVYNHITNPDPTQLFKLQGLYKGNARISAYNTVITAEVDQESLLNKGQPNASLIDDLFREFKWSDGAGTLVPVAFPGIFPDLTRYQAETAQAGVNQGHQPWRLSATQTAQALAANANLLRWQPGAPTTIISGGGKQDLNTIVIVKSTSPGGSSITVSLSRLEGNTNGGIWEATSVTSPALSIAIPQGYDRLTSPMTVSGTGNAFEGKVGKVVVLDHLYSDIGHASVTGVAGNGNTTFSTRVAYNSSFKGGIQEGIVVLYSYSNANSSISGAAIVKEMLS